MPRLVAIACILLWSLPAAAIVGGAAAGDPTGPGRHVVMIVGSRGNSCSGKSSSYPSLPMISSLAWGKMKVVVAIPVAITRSETVLEDQ
jgi:hypothetical protein